LNTMQPRQPRFQTKEYGYACTDNGNCPTCKWLHLENS
jgi:hypothetical protein